MLTTTHQDLLYDFKCHLPHRPFLFQNLSVAPSRRFGYDELIAREAFGLQRLRSSTVYIFGMFLKKLRQSEIQI